MKKTTVLALTIVLALACMCTGAQATEADDVAGFWYLNSMMVEGTSINTASFGLEMTLEINADGTVVMTMNGENMTGAWTLENGVLTIIDDSDEPMGFTVGDGALISDDEQQMTFNREIIVAETHATSPIVEAADIAAFNGKWTADLAEAMGMVIPIEMTGSEMHLSIEDGVVTLTDITGDVEDITTLEATFEGGALVVDYAQDGESEMSAIYLREDGSLSFAIGADGTIYFVLAE